MKQRLIKEAYNLVQEGQPMKAIFLIRDKKRLNPKYKKELLFLYLQLKYIESYKHKNENSQVQMLRSRTIYSLLNFLDNINYPD